MTGNTIAGDRPAIIGTLVYAATARAAVTIEGADALQLVDYIRELEATAREYADRQRDGTAGLRPPVLAFAWLMEHKLRKHDEDRGRYGWDDAHPAGLLQDLRDEARELEEALAEWYRQPSGPSLAAATRNLAGKAADVANMAMMLADRAGGLEGVGPGQAVKRAKRLRHAHRMLERLRRLIDRLAADGVTPAARINWLHTDAAAREWMLRQLDPQGEHRLPTRLEGDGSGEALPPFHPTLEREAAGVTFVDSLGAVHPLSAIDAATVRPIHAGAADSPQCPPYVCPPSTAHR